MEDEAVSLEANNLYWDSDLSVNQIAEKMDLSKGRLYEMIQPATTGLLCPLCGGDADFPNRTAKEKSRVRCPDCGFEGSVTEAISEAIVAKITAAKVEVTGGGGHFSIVVVSTDFEGKSMLDSHRLVYSAIAHLLHGDAALTRWWRRRDVEALPWYFLGKEAAVPGQLTEFHRILLSRVIDQPTMMARLIGAIDRRLSPLDIIPAWRAVWWSLVAAARGRPRVIGELPAAAARGIGMYRELHSRLRLLADAEA